MRRLTELALPLLAFVLLAGSALAKEQDPEKHENWFEAVDPLESNDIKITLRGVHAQMQFVQIKAKIENEGDQYVFVQKEKSAFVLPEGNELAHGGKESKPLLIAPGKSVSHTWKIKAGDGQNFHVDSFTFAPGGFQVASTQGDSFPAEDFQLPAAKNAFQAGDFHCKLDGVSQETKETKAVFSCTWKGDGAGFVDPSMLSVRIPSGDLFANVDRKAKKQMVEPGDTVKFNAVAKIPRKTVDMQFAKLFVVWNETFSSAPFQVVQFDAIDFELDPQKTAEAND